jgi:polysaccharide biosynthesis/export protein
VVTVFSQDDIGVPIGKRSIFVKLEGEIAAAGIYRVEPGETLRHLVLRAGGLTAEAYLYGAEFTRESAKEQQTRRWDEFIANARKQVEVEASTRSQNLTTPEDAASFNERVDAQRRVVERLAEVAVTGRVVLSFNPEQNTLDAVPDLPLEDGDRLFIPSRPATVNVVGAVYNSNSFLHQPGRNLSDYLRQAGGASREADTGRIFIVRASGVTVASGRNTGWFRNALSERILMPGDTVVVPEQLSKTGFLKGLKDWSQVFSQFALGAAAISVFSNR